jgi:membrane protease YdiL (CAAX protease family)
VEHLAAPFALAVLDILVLLLPLPVILFANWHDCPPAGDGAYARVATALGSTIWLLLIAVAMLCALLALIALGSATPAALRSHGLVSYVLVLLASAVIAGLMTVRRVRERLARVLPIDPASSVHGTALVLTVVLAGSQLANQLGVDVLSQQAASGPALQPADLVAQEVPFLLAAALGVGVFIRRNPRETLSRLGLVRPQAWQILVALGAACLFFAFGSGMDQLNHLLTPGTAQKVQAANDRLFGQLSNPIGIATIALSAGICEEALFRGAMQPRLGLLWTAIVFTTVHTQYGLSLDAVAVLILALGLGVLRRLTNTTTSTACHVVYNTLVGVGLADALLGPVIAAGVILVAGAGAGAVLTGRLGSLKTAP